MRVNYTHGLGSKKLSIFSLIVILLFSNSFYYTTLAQALPLPDHIVILIEENQPNFLVIGNTSAAPYINQVANDTSTALFTKMYALEHPSQPDYLDLFAGSNQGVLDDNLPASYPFTTPNMARQLLDHGLTFKTYSEDLPNVGSDVVSASPHYVRKHNPVTNWVGTGTNQVPDTLNQPFTAFPSDFTKLPTVSYVVPNEVNDMHDGFGNSAITAGDTWFHNNLAAYVQWCKNHNSLFIFTFDEDDGLAANNITTFFTGEMVKPGTYTDHWTLYNILRTIEDMYGIGYAGNAATSLPILNCWKAQPTGVNNPSGNTKGINVYPNPSQNFIRFETQKTDAEGVEISILDITGQTITTEKFSSENYLLDVNTQSYSSGMYIYRIVRNGQILQAGKFTVNR